MTHGSKGGCSSRGGFALTQLRTLRTACALVVACGTMGARPASVPSPPIALVDLKRVFEEDAEFQRRMSELKSAVETAEAELRGKQEEIRAIHRRLNEASLVRGERAQLEKQAREATEALTLQHALSKKVFLEREAALYFSSYQRIQAVIRSTMHQRGIAVVFRFTDFEIPKTPDEIGKRLNAPIIAFNEQLDITDEVIARCAVATRAQDGDDSPVEAP